MGQYRYLVNKKNKLFCESHKLNGGIEQEEKLIMFLDFCFEHNLKIECFNEHDDLTMFEEFDECIHC